MDENYPKLPGVYIMKDAWGKIIYIGKAKNLKSRIAQYFQKGGDGRAMIPYLLKKVDRIETIVLESEREALLLENTLIKKHQPKYNSFLKDDRNYACLQIRLDHDFPPLSFVRSKDLAKKTLRNFGPYTGANSVRLVMDYLQRRFRLRKCSDSEFASRKRPCILEQMRRCMAPCSPKHCDKEKYQEALTMLIACLEGKDKSVLLELKEKMQKASDELLFEKAAEYQQILQGFEKMLEVQNVYFYKLVDCNIYALESLGDKACIACLKYREGKLLAQELYVFPAGFSSIGELYSNLLLSEKELPKQIYLGEDFAELKLLRELLACSLTIPSRGKKRALIDLAKKQAKIHLASRQAEQKELLDLQEKLDLKNYPAWIDCIDTSHLAETDPVASVVVFKDAKKASQLYRKFSIKKGRASDYAAMQEVVERRYLRALKEEQLPDLIIIDGGKAHRNLLLKLLAAMDLPFIDIIALAKEKGRHDKGTSQEQIFLKSTEKPILLDKADPLLFFLQRIRDEAHRFAINFHRKKRSERTIKSELDELEGIGPKKRQALLRRFASVEAIKRASETELSSLKILNKKDIEKLIKLRK